MDGSELLSQLRQVLTVAGADDGTGNVADALYDIEERLADIRDSGVKDALTKMTDEIVKLNDTIGTSAAAIASAVLGLTEEIRFARAQQQPRL